MNLSPPLCQTFSVAKLFQDNHRRINSLDFDATGTRLITASDDESLMLYDCIDGKHINTVFSKKYGCQLVRFTHKSTNIVYASTKEDDGLRYMSLHDNKFLRYFKGHRKMVTSLEMSPKDDSFVSGSLDGTIRLWDLRSSECEGLIRTTGEDTMLAYDSTGQVMTVALGNSIRFYDVRKYSAGPFLSTTFVDPKLPQQNIWHNISFSNNGRFLFIQTKSNLSYLMDAFNGKLLYRLVGYSNSLSMGLQGGFTPDSNYILSGSTNGTIHFWNIENIPVPHDINSVQDGYPIANLEFHREPPQVVAFNPRFMMFVSCDTQLAFWLPK